MLIAQPQANANLGWNPISSAKKAAKKAARAAKKAAGKAKKTATSAAKASAHAAAAAARKAKGAASFAINVATGKILLDQAIKGARIVCRLPKPVIIAAVAAAGTMDPATAAIVVPRFCKAVKKKDIRKIASMLPEILKIVAAVAASKAKGIVDQKTADVAANYSAQASAAVAPIAAELGPKVQQAAAMAAQAAQTARMFKASARAAGEVHAEGRLPWEYVRGLSGADEFCTVGASAPDSTGAYIALGFSLLAVGVGTYIAIRG